MSTPIVGLIMGIIFGASLVLAGLTDPDKIIGSLRLKDFHALRTVIVFVLVGMLGTWLLGFAGAANLKIESAAVVSLLLGGALVGIGLALSGYCPGTGLAAAASGRIDALFTVLGMLFGAHVYVLIYPSIAVPLEKIANFGSVTLPQVTGISTASWIVPVFITGAAVLLITRTGKQPQSSPSMPEETLAEPHIRIEGQPAGKSYSRTVSPAFASSCIGTVSMFSRWKNFLFMVMVLCLFALQASFWLVKTGYVSVENNTTGNTSAVSNSTQQNYGDPTGRKPAKVEVPMKLPWKSQQVAFEITFERLAMTVRIANIVLALAALLYCIVIFFGLTISLAGRFGGLNHICAAFYFSLIALVLMLPWQAVSGSVSAGAAYSPGELAGSFGIDSGGILGQAFAYMRFTGYAALALLTLILCQLRSRRWSKTAVQRLKNAVLANSYLNTSDA